MAVVNIFCVLQNLFIMVSKKSFSGGGDMKIIPIMLCLNDNYVIPCFTAISSLVKRSSSDYNYSFYILHSNITKKHQKKFNILRNKFSNIDINFIDMGTQYTEMFENVSYQAYWSKEIFYKFNASSLFPQYDRIIITDVDVIFCDDIVPDWELFLQDQENYLAGVRVLSQKSKNQEYADWIFQKWTEEERKKSFTGAGYWLLNLLLIRKNQLEEKFLKFAQENLYRLTQPEQQVVNMVCYPKIKLLHPKAMVCAYDYKSFSTPESYHYDDFYSAKIVAETLEFPVQLHYAGKYKPWNVLFTTKSYLWWKELLSLHDASLIFESIFLMIKQGVYFQLLKDKIRYLIKRFRFINFLYKSYKKVVRR